MKIPLTPRLKYTPAGIVNNYEQCVEIPDAPSLLNCLPTFGLKRPPDPINYDIPENIDTPKFLLPYQQTAVRTLFHGGVLSDGPRMGKTVTAIGWTYVQAHYRPKMRIVTIICPSILIPQWEAHIAKFGCDRLEYRVINMDASTFPAATDMLIIDEAHHFKHEMTERYQKVYFMHREITLCLEATPLSDRGSDIYALLHLVREHWFPSLEQFKTWYVLPISRFEPLMERLKDDTANLWLWRNRRLSGRDVYQHNFHNEKESYEFTKNLPRPIVIFTDKRVRAESLSKKLQAKVFTGDYQLAERMQNVHAFQRGEIDCLICSFWKMGDGIDLSTAKTCVVYGHDWTDSTIDQAIARTDHIDINRQKADVHICVWPGKITPKKSIERIKESFIPDWSVDVTEFFD